MFWELTKPEHAEIKKIFDEMNNYQNLQDLKKIRNGVSHHFHILYPNDGFIQAFQKDSHITLNKSLKERVSFKIDNQEFFCPISIVNVLNSIYMKMEDWIKEIVDGVVHKHSKLEGLVIEGSF